MRKIAKVQANQLSPSRSFTTDRASLSSRDPANFERLRSDSVQASPPPTQLVHFPRFIRSLRSLYHSRWSLVNSSIFVCLTTDDFSCRAAHLSAFSQSLKTRLPDVSPSLYVIIARKYWCFALLFASLFLGMKDSSKRSVSASNCCTIRPTGLPMLCQ